MSKAVAGLDFFTIPENFNIAPIVVIFGDEPFLVRETSLKIRRLVLPNEDAEFSFNSYDCSRQARAASSGSLSWTQVQKELETMSLFGGGKRVIQLESADTFLSENRAKMEKYAQAPSENSILILILTSFPSTTNFYKLIEKCGLIIDCRSVTEDLIVRWLTKRAQDQHKTDLELSAASLLVERIGTDLGSIDQELARLALLVSEPRRMINVDLVEKNVGNWRTRKVWDMVDAIFFGTPERALLLLDQLLASAETPVGLLAQTALTVRRFAAATRIFLDSEKAGKRLPLNIVLINAGFPKWAAAKSQIQMKKLGRIRGQKLLQLLIDTDLALKGDSQASPRLILEKFIVYISHPLCR